MLEIGENLHIFPLSSQSMGDRGSKKAYTHVRTGMYMHTKFGCDRSIVVGCRPSDDRQTNKQTNIRTSGNDNKAHSLRDVTQQTCIMPVGDLDRAPPLSKFRGLPFRNKVLNQNSVEILYAGNVGHHYTKISENWIKNCRRSSISRDPSEK